MTHPTPTVGADRSMATPSVDPVDGTGSYCRDDEVTTEQVCRVEHDNEQVIGTSGAFRFSERGLRIDGLPTYEEWTLVGTSLFTLANSASWSIGDWLVYGEGRGDWGETYAQAIDLTMKSYGTLAQLVRVSRGFDFEARFKTLSWSHHQAVLSLPADERRELLQRSEDEGWSRDQLRAHVRGRRCLDRTSPRTMCPKCGWRW